MVSFLLALRPKSYKYSFLPNMRATCPAHVTLLDFIILIILEGEYEVLSSLLGSFLQPHIITIFFSPNILPNTLF
jgi:hypothetical protein